MSFIWFCLISHGLTQILVHGKILDPIRPSSGKLGQLLKCSMCTGFWVGLFLWSISSNTELFSFDDSFVTGLLLGFAGSASAYIFDVMFDDNGLKVEKLAHIKRRRR